MFLPSTVAAIALSRHGSPQPTISLIAPKESLDALLSVQLVMFELNRYIEQPRIQSGSTQRKL